MDYWPRLVEEYTHRKLTLGKDKLTALSGLAEYIATRTKDSTSESDIARQNNRYSLNEGQNLCLKYDEAGNSEARTFHGLPIPELFLAWA